MKMIYTFPNGLRYEVEPLADNIVREEFYNIPTDLEFADCEVNANEMFNTIKDLTAKYGNPALQIG